MNRWLIFGILPAGGILIVVLGLVRQDDPGDRRPARRTAADRGAVPEVVGRAHAPPAPPTATEQSFESVLAAAARGEPPRDVLSGPFKVEGPGGGPDAPAELALTESQRAIVGALMAERDARLQELRNRPAGADVDRICAEAQRVHAACMASIRTALLPEQQAVFDRLVTSGRWGGYTFVIPAAR